MKAIMTSMVCRCILYLAILAFIFGIIYISGCFKFLYLLVLLPTCVLIPSYKVSTGQTGNIQEGIDTGSDKQN